jgi:hypothetical protein
MPVTGFAYDGLVGVLCGEGRWREGEREMGEEGDGDGDGREGGIERTHGVVGCIIKFVLFPKQTKKRAFESVMYGWHGLLLLLGVQGKRVLSRHLSLATSSVTWR